MFLKQANSDMENGFKKKRKYPLKKFTYSGNWKFWKRHKKNTAIEGDYLTYIDNDTKSLYRVYLIEFPLTNYPLINFRVARAASL